MIFRIPLVYLSPPVGSCDKALGRRQARHEGSNGRAKALQNTESAEQIQQIEQNLFTNDGQVRNITNLKLQKVLLESHYVLGTLQLV